MNENTPKHPDEPYLTPGVAPGIAPGEAPTDYEEAHRRFADRKTIGTIVNPALTWPIAEVAPSATADAGVAQERTKHSFESVYRTWFTDVARWVRARGANDADVEDLTQEVFIIVRRKLDQFDGRNLPGFLYRITERTVRDHRRSKWVRNLFRNPSSLPDIAEPGIDCVQAIQQRERRKALDALLAKMTEKRRTTFVLFEIEGYSGDEIAQIQSLPLDTVWTRLHHARRDFMRLVAELPPRGQE